MGKQLKTVFLNSTGRDLQEYRDAVFAAINRMDGFHCVRMEDFGARAADPDTFCRALAAECEVYVGLLGHLYGSCPSGETKSFTEREYDAAIQAQVPRLVFVATDDFPLNKKSLWIEAAQQAEEVERFHARVKQDLVVGSFEFGEVGVVALAGAVTEALHNWWATVVERASDRQDSVESPNTSTTRSRGADLAEVERRYLEYLADRYRNLDFKGMGVAGLTVRFSLLDLYVPLKARRSLGPWERGAESFRLAGRLATEEEAKAAGKLGEPQLALDLLRENGGLVLLGDPGAGKSTFLKFLALSLASGAGEVLGLGGRLPVLVSIAGYAEILARIDMSLDDFIAGYLFARVREQELAEVLASALREGRALLLLDGLDEVRDVALQRTVADRVQHFFSYHREAGNKFLVTSRIVGYPEVRLTAQGLVECTLVDFDEKGIGAFLDRWVVVVEEAVRGGGDATRWEASRERRELQEAIEHNPAVRSLAANPLLLTILALMKRQGVTLPAQRVKLYDTYVRTLLESWNQVRSLSGRAVGQSQAKEVLKVLAPLALWMHEESPGVGLVKGTDLKRRLAELCTGGGAEVGFEEAEAAAEAFLRDLDGTSLLVERGGGQYGFLHLTFLEFLAAYALVKRGQAGVEASYEELAPRVGPATWHEVVLLALGFIGAVEERDEVASALLEQLIEERPGPPGVAVAVAGRALADLGDAGVLAETREKVLGALQQTMRDAETMPAPQRAEVGEVLAMVGDPRREVTTLAGMEFCWVPPGKFLMGSLEDDPEADANEKPQHEVEIEYGYWIGRYPVTVAQFQEYCVAAAVTPEDSDSLRGLWNGPVTWVSWHEALRFCGWLTQEGAPGWGLPAGWSVSLPSEAEWEKAARGGEVIPFPAVVQGWDGLALVETGLNRNPVPGRSYPWGEGEDPSAANFDKSGIGRPSAMGCFPRGVSAVGCEELSGNTWEWTRSHWGKDWTKPERTYPYEADDGREDLKAGDDMLRVLRGGSYFDNSRRVRCAARGWSPPSGRYDDFGFRVVVCPFFPEP